MSAKTARAATAEANVVCPRHLKGSTLPRDWEWVSLGNICRTTSGGTPSRKNREYFEGDIPWVKSGELPDGPVSEIEEYITGDAVKNSSAKQFPKGTLLIALYGATVGKLGVLTQEAATNQAVCAIFPPDDLETKYLFWYLRFVRSDLIAQAIGGAQPNISQGILRNLLIPIAPLYQQKRIVAEIEKEFSRLDEAVANLKRVKANLKCYKAAVLKAAVEGKLTEDWRKQHPDVGPAGKLLERILAERRTRWNARGKYKEPAKPDTSNLPLLPEKWTWASVDQLTSHITSGSRDWTRYYGRGSGTFILAQNVRLMRLDLSECQAVDPPKNDAETTRTRVSIGDILVTIVGAKTGEVCRIPKELVDHFVCQSVALLRPLMPASAKFMELYLASPENGQAQWKQYIYGQGRPHLSFEQLKMTAIALPSPDEQNQIVAEVERRLSVIDELEATVEANLTRADRLRQSILSQAFSGKLVGAGAPSSRNVAQDLPVAAEPLAPFGVIR